MYSLQNTIKFSNLTKQKITNKHKLKIRYIDNNYNNLEKVFLKDDVIELKVVKKITKAVFGYDNTWKNVSSFITNALTELSPEEIENNITIQSMENKEDKNKEDKINIIEPFDYKYHFDLPERNDNEIRLIYCGTLREEENILEIIKEFQAIHKQRSEVILKIVYGKIYGSTEFTEKVNNYIINGVKGITFKYNLGDKETCYEIATSDIGICWRKNGCGDNCEVTTKMKEYEMYGLYIVRDILELNFLNINSLLIRKHLITTENGMYIFKDNIKLYNSSIYLYKQNICLHFNKKTNITLIKNKKKSFSKFIFSKNTLHTEKTRTPDKCEYQIHISSPVNSFNIQNKPLYITFEHISFEHILFKHITNVYLIDWKKNVSYLNEINFKNSYIIFYNLNFNTENEAKINTIFSKHEIIYYMIYNNKLYRENIINLSLILNKRIGNEYNIFFNNKQYSLNELNDTFDTYNLKETINCCLASYPKRFELLQTTLHTLEKNGFDSINLFMNSYTFKQCVTISNTFKINNILLDNIGSIRAAGKFFWCNQLDNYFFICDDDINYPNDYKKIGMENINNDNNSLYSCLGARFKPKVIKFPLKNERLFNSKFPEELQQKTKVHLIGTGVSFYKIKKNNFPTFDYLLSYVVYNDDLLAIWCNKNNINQYTIKRKEKWLISNENMEIGLYEEKAIDPDKQHILKMYHELNWE